MQQASTKGRITLDRRSARGELARQPARPGSPHETVSQARAEAFWQSWANATASRAPRGGADRGQMRWYRDEVPAGELRISAEPGFFLGVVWFVLFYNKS